MSLTTNMDNASQLQAYLSQVALNQLYQDRLAAFNNNQQQQQLLDYVNLMNLQGAGVGAGLPGLAGTGAGGLLGLLGGGLGGLGGGGILGAAAAASALGGVSSGGLLLPTPPSMAMERLRHAAAAAAATTTEGKNSDVPPPAAIASSSRTSGSTSGDQKKAKGTTKIKAKTTATKTKAPASVASAAAATAATDRTKKTEVGTTTSSSSSPAPNFRPGQWQVRYQELVEFRNEMGHCLVPHNWVGNRPLAQWVKRQRYQFRLKTEGTHSTLSDDRKRALDAIGFVWNSHQVAWEEKYYELQEFAKRHGHCNVPTKYPPNHSLAVWVKCQRRQSRLLAKGDTNHMSMERYLKLKSLGFVFNPRKLKDAEVA